MVFVGNYELQQAAASLDSDSGVQTLASALHSRTGDVKESFVAGSGNIAMLEDDVLDLTYEIGMLSSSGSVTESWYLLLTRSVALGASTQQIDPDPTPDLPESFALYQNQPNPSRGTTAIRFDLPTPTEVRLEIFDIRGRRVTTLIQTALPAGRHSAAWDHRDSGGRRVAAGAYVLRITAGEFHSERKMIVLR